MSGVVKISALPLGDSGQLEPNTPGIPITNAEGVTQRFTPKQVTDAVGPVEFSGVFEGEGLLGTAIVTTAVPHATPLSALAVQTPGTLLWFDASGHAHAAVVGAGLTMVDGVLMAATPAAANKSTTALTRKYFHGF